MTYREIISSLPYTSPFLFVDTIEDIDENGVSGTYTYPADAFFYRGHFKGFPITPGVILTETMAQIGLVCLGIFLMRDQLSSHSFPKIAMSSSEVEYYLPVFPAETVKVSSQKIYFRFGKLKCRVEMQNSKNEVICKGVIAGMIERKPKPTNQAYEK